MLASWAFQLFNGNATMAPEVRWIFRASFLFCASGLIFILCLSVSRMLKSFNQRRERTLRAQYQKTLNKIIVNAMFSEEGFPNASFEFYLAELRLMAGNSRFARQLLLTQILEAKKSLTGNSATALVKAYYAMPLFTESLDKLKKSGWQKKALAIREMAEMGYREGIPAIEKFLYSKNTALQEESFMALVRLEDEPLSFFNHFKGDLSLWMRINIYHHLRNTDFNKLPQFSRYFNHPNLSVRLFTMRMARQFKQTSSLPGIVDMLYSDNAKIVGLAIAAVGELEAYAYRGEIIKLATHVWRFKKLSKRVVICLGCIGDKEEDVDVVGKFLQHPCYDVRFEAVGALRKLGAQGERLLDKFNVASGRTMDGILRHYADALLT